MVCCGYHGTGSLQHETNSHCWHVALLNLVVLTWPSGHGGDAQHQNMFMVAHRSKDGGSWTRHISLAGMQLASLTAAIKSIDDDNQGSLARGSHQLNQDNLFKVPGLN
jgi:hypothetical protein